MASPLVEIGSLSKYEDKEVTLKGWVSNQRTSKKLVFVIMRDGTGFAQCVLQADTIGEKSFATAEKLNLEDTIEVSGKVVKDERQIGGYEVQCSRFERLFESEDYPIAKKEHGVDFLMDHRHLWLRSRRQWAVMRVRNQIIYAIHRFFQEQGFVQMDAPIFTGNACEGTTDLFETDFFGDPAYLSQSGQLYGEAMAIAHRKIYTFGPTFRAEKSKTRRHLSEFWMIEPEMVFYDNAQNMELIEAFIRYVIRWVLDHKECRLAFELLERDLTSLKHADRPFPRMTYDEAVAILKGEREVDGRRATDVLEADLEEAHKTIREKEAALHDYENRLKQGSLKKKKQNDYRHQVTTLKAELRGLEARTMNIPQWIESAKKFEHGADFGGSDETVLTRLFDAPVIVHRWPKAIKAFYMKEDPDDPKYVKAVDVLAPEGFGEIVGGSERETDKDYLIKQIKAHKLPMEEFEWYLDLRRYGNVPHAGFGLGLERFVAWICNLHHVRETIPFPRMYGRLFP